MSHLDQEIPVSYSPDDRDRTASDARDAHITRLFVIGFAFVEALFLAWALLSRGLR